MRPESSGSPATDTGVSSHDRFIEYDLILQETTASSGYFAAIPRPVPDFDSALAYLKDHPNDEMMYRHVLSRIHQLGPENLPAVKPHHGVLFERMQLEADLMLSDEPVSTGRHHQPDKRVDGGESPLPYLRIRRQPDQRCHSRWAAALNANLAFHKELPRIDPQDVQRLLPHGVDGRPPISIARIRQSLCRHAVKPAPARPSSAETAALALDRLAANGILAGPEMRHIASLSPYGLLRRWHLDIEVHSGRHRYRMTGIQTAYGRGVNLDDARASYAMEIVERCSSFASVSGQAIAGTTSEHQLVRSTYSDLQQDAVKPIDPNCLGIDASYHNETLYWIQGLQAGRNHLQRVWVPVQAIFLFCNLDEISLFASRGSTGLASGNTITEARLSALLEWVERDGEAVFPYHRSQCFQVEPKDPHLAALFDDYRQRGIQFQFQDISPDDGIPCCKCFVCGTDGTIAKGTAAHLDGRRAVVSALTETPYPYPYGPPSAPGLAHIPLLNFEDLPNFSSGSLPTDLMMVERYLTAHFAAPIYVDLTRKDLQIPVVRALVPGMCATAELDAFSRLPARLLANCQRIHDLHGLNSD